MSEEEDPEPSLWAEWQLTANKRIGVHFCVLYQTPDSGTNRKYPKQDKQAGKQIYPPPFRGNFWRTQKCFSGYDTGMEGP